MLALRNKVVTSIMIIILSVFVSSFIFAQNTTNTSDGRFHDDMLDHLVGKWVATGMVHGNAGSLFIEAEWVMNHQWLRVTERSPANVPGMNIPFEGVFYFGYGNKAHPYIVHLMNVWGNDESDGLFYGTKTGNQIILLPKSTTKTIIVQKFTWQPKSGSWNFINAQKTGAKEEAPFLNLQVVARK